MNLLKDKSTLSKNIFKYQNFNEYKDNFENKIVNK